ncbi:cytidylyltransferase domain-containing protein [Campylobacter sp. US33a]|uniref:acylneuraminate cytidylyltransferase family protein n=1 Tax=Campylobacter sp. US33a TaxID=2498120 RepID=UPI001068C7CD|nr:acylneuraminate cytidylyltransferase family protein [Campylobacter sp. US33a]TEY03978.1 acylneuraminate cytidylyltransferase family protein [Campylobacter sp. US33a]
MKINVFLPCRKGSQRILNKNTKPFGKFKNGLLEIKLKHLIQSNLIDRIYLSTNDDEILAYAKNLNHKKLVLHKRDEKLASNTASADDLINHAYELIQDGEILWTHVTSPFFTDRDYNKVVKTYTKVLQDGFDSLVSVTPLKGFFWNENGPINYDIKVKNWPPTQETQTIYELNSAVFLANASIYKNLKNRMGIKPYFYETDKIKGFDIDWKEDFLMGEAILKANLVNGGG